MNKKVTTKIKDYNEPEINKEKAAKLSEMAEAGKVGFEVKEKAYLYSTLDYPTKLTYTNGEEFIIAPKAKELVDAALIDKAALQKGLLLKLV